ncbi:hypothetical protein COB57_01945 [Candidatus Peregrinibacteria bacterium]|nr:MAG: hypothetical protein COB57_01945 [Candidatus Peregrinibacteria bacterium]
MNTSIQQTEQNKLLKKRTKCEIWTRVMGYHRPVSQYNNGKTSEYYSRQTFNEQAAENSQFMKDFN